MKKHAQARNIKGLVHKKNMGTEGHMQKDIHTEGQTHEETYPWETYTRGDIYMERHW